MKLKEIISTVDGTLLTKQLKQDLDIHHCGAADLMSDVLSIMKPGSLLVTGLVNLQSIRTAEMANLAAIIYVRGKAPGSDAIDLANELGIPLIASHIGMYEMCGRLYKAGLMPTMQQTKG